MLNWDLNLLMQPHRLLLACGDEDLGPVGYWTLHLSALHSHQPLASEYDTTNFEFDDAQLRNGCSFKMCKPSGWLLAAISFWGLQACCT